MADDTLNKKNSQQTIAAGGEVKTTPSAGDHLLPGAISTSRFSLGPSVHARVSIMRRAAKSWMAVALPFVALVIAGLIYDTRLLFIAAFGLFILFPTLILFAWYGLLTRPWAIASLFPQQVTLHPDSEVTVDYFAGPDSDTVSPADLVIPRAEISDCQQWGRNVVVSYGNRHELIIPLAAFKDPADVTAFITRLESAHGGESSPF